jgi:thioredoxin-like negative regulator of GroEL
MCGSCQEFAPTWETVEAKAQKSLPCAKINIDEKAGLAIAQKYGILNQGIPNVQLVVSGNKFVPIVTGTTCMMYIVDIIAIQYEKQ